VGLRGLLHQRKAGVLDRWFGLVMDTYPEDAHRALKSNRDPFANPVGHIFREATGKLFDFLLIGAGKDELAAPLEEMVKVRAVQDFKPSDGVAFVFLLKRAVREELGAEAGAAGLQAELAAFESRVDALALQAFDIYVACVKRLFEIRAAEVKGSVHMLLRRANAAG
jgi:hypothetical protein